MQLKTIDGEVSHGFMVHILATPHTTHEDLSRKVVEAFAWDSEVLDVSCDYLGEIDQYEEDDKQTLEKGDNG